LVNASRLWIPKMYQIIEIMHFSMPIVVMGVSGISSLDAVQTPYHNENTPKEPRLVPGQEIHKVRCLAMLEYFKKLMRHGNS
jgi:hypothetical protein